MNVLSIASRPTAPIKTQEAEGKRDVLRDEAWSMWTRWFYRELKARVLCCRERMSHDDIDAILREGTARYGKDMYELGYKHGRRESLPPYHRREAA